MERMKLGVTCIDNDGVLNTAEPGSLFHGILNFTVKAGTDYEGVVSLTKNSNYINVRVRGIENISTAEINTSIYGYNGHYSYDNSAHTETALITYIAGRRQETNYIIDRFQVYRLFAGDGDIALRIQAEDENGMVYFFEEPLIPILLRGISTGNAQNYLDRTGEYQIPVNFSDDGSAIVEAWEDIDNNTEL